MSLSDGVEWGATWSECQDAFQSFSPSPLPFTSSFESCVRALSKVVDPQSSSPAPNSIQFRVGYRRDGTRVQGDSCNQILRLMRRGEERSAHIRGPRPTDQQIIVLASLFSPSVPPNHFCHPPFAQPPPPPPAVLLLQSSSSQPTFFLPAELEYRISLPSGGRGRRGRRSAGARRLT